MKPESLLSKENQTRGTDTNVLINEEILRKVLKLASDNGLKLRGHTLVWHSQTPEWFFHKDYNVDKSLVSKDVMRPKRHGKAIFKARASHIPAPRKISGW